MEKRESQYDLVANGIRVLAERELTIQPLLHVSEPLMPETLHALPQCGVLTERRAVIEGCAAAGMGTKQLFFRAASASEDDLRRVHGHCCWLLERLEDISRTDMLAGPLLTGGRLEEVGIRLSPIGEDMFTSENIPQFARLLRRSENLAVRSVFLPLDAAGDLSQQAKAAFSLVKKLRADLPCLFHSFCFEGLLEPLGQGNAALEQTLEMLAALNDTSLYAQFYIS